MSHGVGQFVYSFHAYCFCILISAQERLLGAALGSLLTGAVVFEQRRSIYKSINHYEPRVILLLTSSNGFLWVAGMIEVVGCANCWTYMCVLDWDSWLSAPIDFLSWVDWLYFWKIDLGATNLQITLVFFIHCSSLKNYKWEIPPYFG